MDTVVDGLPVGRFMIGQSRIAQEQAKRIWFDKLRRAQEKRVMSHSLCALAARLQYDCCSSVADATFTRQGSQVRTLHRPPSFDLSIEIKHLGINAKCFFVLWRYAVLDSIGVQDANGCARAKRFPSERVDVRSLCSRDVSKSFSMVSAAPTPMLTACSRRLPVAP